MIGGHSRAGKDEMGNWLSRWTPLRHPGALSQFLAPYVVASRLGIPVDLINAVEHRQLMNDAYANRHRDKEEWFRIGNECRDKDTDVLLRPALAHGELVVGPRDPREVERCASLTDYRVWIDRDVPPDPTCKYGPDACDAVIRNRGTLEEFHERIRRFADAMRIPRFTTPLPD